MIGIPYRGRACGRQWHFAKHLLAPLAIGLLALVGLPSGARAGACEHDGDCKAGRVCVRGTCANALAPAPAPAASGRSCAGDGDCGITEVCESKRCVLFTQRAAAGPPAPAAESSAEAPPPARAAQQPATFSATKPQAAASPAAPPTPAASAMRTGQSLAVLEFEVGKGIDLDRLYFSDLVRGRVRAAAPTLFLMTRESTEVILKEFGKSMADCAGECEVDVARKLGADYVISGRITRVGSRLALTLRLHSSADARLIGSEEARGQNADEMVDRVGTAVASLMKQLGAPAPRPDPVETTGSSMDGTLSISSNPVANVTIDGEQAGRTPLDRVVFAGVHNVAFSAEGYSPTARTVVAQAGRKTRMSETLQPFLADNLAFGVGVFFAPADSLSFLGSVSLDYKIVAGWGNVWLGALFGLGDLPMGAKTLLTSRKVNLGDILLGPRLEVSKPFTFRGGNESFAVFAALELPYTSANLTTLTGSAGVSGLQVLLTLGARIWFFQLGLTLPVAAIGDDFGASVLTLRPSARFMF